MLLEQAFILQFLILTSVESLPTTKDANPCSTVSCYHNSMCVIDPSTDEPVCQCLLHECDGAPAFPICAEGTTYKSPCHVRLQMCVAQKRIAVQHAGPCGPQECNTKKPCPFHGHCGGGQCSCEKCDGVEESRDVDIARPRRLSVCGSDGVTYASECHLRYQSCTSRMTVTVVKMSSCYRRRHTAVITRLSENQLLLWLQTSFARDSQDHDTAPDICLPHTGSCPKYELRGCLPATHPREKFLGVYTLDQHRRHAGSPVYRKLTHFRSRQNNVYLSRYTSSRIVNGSWVVGSKIGSGVGWFANIDSSREPESITGMWHSTASRKENPWQREPRVSGRCLTKGRCVTAVKEECNLGDERGWLGLNWQSITQEVPLYELQIRNRRGREATTYKPGERIKIDVLSNNRALRFTSLYVSFRNDDGICGLPEMSKSRQKFEVKCSGRVLTLSGKRMKRATMRLKAPLRGCITISVFVKSARGEVFYDTPSKESTVPTPLTATICQIGYKKPVKHITDIGLS